MHFFPPLYPDELLYSALARYHNYSGNESFKKTMRDLFGCETVCSVTDLPCNLDVLASRIPGKVISKEKLLYDHTLMPYYSHFIPSDRLENIREEMYFSNGRSIHMLVGLTANGVKPPKNLRYCTVCAMNNRAQYGLAYWHRAHQIPGVIVCYKHKVNLREANVPYSQRRNKHEFVPLDTITININTEEVIVENYLNLFIAQNSFYLLNYNSEKIVRKNNVRNIYLKEIQNINMLSVKGRIKFYKLIPSFNNYYGRDLLTLMGSHVEEDKQHTWLHKFLRNSDEVIHPLRHILLHGFLGQSITSTILESNSSSTLVNPFFNGPWPCLNKVSRHFGEKVITLCTITRCSDTGKPVGTFTCECGFVYSRRGPDTSEGAQMEFGRIKEFGDVWKNKLWVLWGDEKLSLREKARQLGVDPKTVKRQANLLITDTNIYNGTLKTLNGFIQTRRNEWIFIKNEQPSPLRKSLYNWLYKHDRNWLMQNKPNNMNQRSNKNRVDWNYRDENMAMLVRETANQLITIRQLRITKAEIGRRIGYLSLIEKQLEKLPKTKRELERVVETTEQFQIRRIDLSIEELMRNNEILKVWKIAKKAGLRTDVLNHLKDLIIKKIRLNSSI
ncbi:TnsD family Tn7-like transposition protein [Psychrobacillus sp. FSL W7-1493]|uniref:TnsD family Tn7-like transposition protein n=1 Tax=unclassified Psychrobacillus TaxID=2636677 RepID=UPI0030FA9428